MKMDIERKERRSIRVKYREKEEEEAEKEASNRYRQSREIKGEK